MITKLYIHPVKKKKIFQKVRGMWDTPLDTPTTGRQACGESWTSSKHRDHAISGPHTMEISWCLRLTVLFRSETLGGSQYSFCRSPQLHLLLPSSLPQQPKPQSSGPAYWRLSTAFYKRIVALHVRSLELSHTGTLVQYMRT